MLVDIKVNNNSEYPDESFRAIAVSVLCKAMMDGRKIPERVRIRTVKQQIERMDGSLRQAHTGALTFVDPKTALIRVVTGGRDFASVMQTVYHEMTHLIRLVNGQLSPISDVEEQQNRLEMSRCKLVIEHLASILILDSTDSLRDYAEEDKQDSGTGGLVRAGGVAEGV